MKANVVWKFFVSPGVNEDIYEAKNSQPKKKRLASQQNEKRSRVKLFESRATTLPSLVNEQCLP